jgi:hypothetical protein
MVAQPDREKQPKARIRMNAVRRPNVDVSIRMDMILKESVERAPGREQGPIRI